MRGRDHPNKSRAQSPRVSRKNAYSVPNVSCVSVLYGACLSCIVIQHALDCCSVSGIRFRIVNPEYSPVLSSMAALPTRRSREGARHLRCGRSQNADIPHVRQPLHAGGNERISEPGIRRQVPPLPAIAGALSAITPLLKSLVLFQQTNGFFQSIATEGIAEFL